MNSGKLPPPPGYQSIGLPDAAYTDPSDKPADLNKPDWAENWQNILFFCLCGEILFSAAWCAQILFNQATYRFFISVTWLCFLIPLIIWLWSFGNAKRFPKVIVRRSLFMWLGFFLAGCLHYFLLDR